MAHGILSFGVLSLPMAPSREIAILLEGTIPRAVRPYELLAGCGPRYARKSPRSVNLSLEWDIMLETGDPDVMYRRQISLQWLIPYALESRREPIFNPLASIKEADSQKSMLSGVSRVVCRRYSVNHFDKDCPTHLLFRDSYGSE
jgi:hypothetical protein